MHGTYHFGGLQPGTTRSLKLLRSLMNSADELDSALGCCMYFRIFRRTRRFTGDGL